MSTVLIPRVRPARFDLDRLRDLARRFDLDGEAVESEEAVVISGGGRVIVHGQPFNRMAGVTTVLDTDRGIAPDPEFPERRQVVDPGRAADLVTEVLRSTGLGTDRTRTDLTLSSRVEARVTEGVHFDGRERRRFPAKTDVRVRLTLDELVVSGPRAGVSATFTETDVPLRMTATTWDAVEPYAEATLVEREEAIAELLASRQDRRSGRAPIEVLSATLAYWAGEYAGGADLLEPSWFVEVVSRVRDDEVVAPRQLVRLPAAR